MKILLTIIYLICSTSGLIFMKLGGDSLLLNLKQGFTFKIGYVTSLGFMLYIISFILWQKLITIFDLSYIYPISVGIIQVLVLIASVFIFKEKINLTNFFGILFVIIGIILISIKK